MSVPPAAEDQIARPSAPEIRVPASAAAVPFLIAVLVLAGSLWLSIGMGLKACPLCFYQRTFVMGVVAVLGIGLLAGQRHRGVLDLLALPLAVAGLGVAVFHEYLELSGKLECPAGLLGVGTAPQQSLAGLAVLLVSLVAGIARGSKASNSSLPVAAAVVLGLLLAWGSVASAPPMPPAPTKAYDPQKQPLEMCRPPFRPQ